MLDRDLAELYGVETKVLNQAVKRNINRFPEDFMFVLSDEEWLRLRSQIVTSNSCSHLSPAFEIRRLNSHIIIEQDYVSSCFPIVELITASSPYNL